MSGFEPCGLCGSKHGVRFPIPGRDLDSCLCAECVKAAVTAHAEADSGKWAIARQTGEVPKSFPGGKR
jgi:hypothetical protein